MPAKDVVIRGAGVLTVAGVLIGGGAYVVGGGGGGDPTVANIWVQNGGGTCAGGRSATPILLANATSPDRICGTFDLAWDAMSNGDTARVVASTSYAGQSITGNKTAPTYIIAEDGTEITDTLDLQANYVNIENLIVDIGCTDNAGQESGSAIDGDNVTWLDVDIWGCRVSIETGPEGNGGDDFTWIGGTLGEPGTTPSGRDDPDGEPVWLNGESPHIEGITFRPAAATGGFHLEHIRIQEAQNVELIGNTFPDNGSVGSGFIFCTSASSSSTAVNNWHLINNNFGIGVNGSYTIQCHANVQNSNGWVFAYNTFRVPTEGSPGEVLLHDGSEAGIAWVGNLGPKPGAGCSGTWIKNVWQNNTNTACGTDTWVNGPQEGTGNLGINADGIHLDAGSPAIDAAETPGASDYCTDASYVNSLDIEGTVRPQGTICDAGADERVPQGRMSKSFNGTTSIMNFGMTAGFLNSGTPKSMIILLKILETTDNNKWLSFLDLELAGANQVAFGRENSSPGKIYVLQGGSQPTGQTITDADSWMILGYTVADGTSTPDIHKMPIGGARNTTAATGTVGDFTNNIDSILIGGDDDPANILVGAAAVWNATVLTTGQLDGILSAKTTASISALSPTWLVDDSDDFATNLVNPGATTGNLSSQTAISDSADDPSGWVYGISGGTDYTGTVPAAAAATAAGSTPLVSTMTRPFVSTLVA